MRAIVAAALVLCVAGAGDAQSVVGRYTVQGAQGAPVVFVLEANGPGRVKGSLSGNGIMLTADGEMDGSEAAGTLKGSTGSALFEATRQGNQLTLMLVEVDANGTPNPATIRQLAMTLDNSAPAPAATAPGAAQQAAGGARAGSPPATKAGSAQDEQLRQLLLSRAWCTFSYSGGSTYSGGSYGRSSSTRTVFSANGFVQQTSSSENTNSGAAGNVYGGSSGGQNAQWRVEGGTLSVSGDGVTWKPVKLEVYQNSAGYPILKADGVEYSGCR